MRSIVDKILQVGKWMGLVSLSILMLLTAVDVFARYFLGTPIPGTQDVTELLMAVTVFMGLAITERNQGHIRVEILIYRMGSRARAVLKLITDSLSALVVIILSWRLLINFISSGYLGDETIILKIHKGPFVLMSSVGFAMLAAQFILQIYGSMVQLGETK